MKKKSIIVALVIVQLLILGGAAVFIKSRSSIKVYTSAVTTGTTYYVSTTGSDTNPGTSSSPFATFAYANSKLQPGDTLLLYGGTYTQKLNVTVSGTSGFPITIGAVSGQNPIIDAQYAFNPTIQLSGNYINISGLTAKNGSSICEMLTGQYLNSSNMIITGCSDHGTFVSGQHITVTTHTIHDSVLANSARATNAGWGSAMKTAEGANYVTLSNNTVYNNYGEGFGITKTANITINNNLIYDNYSINLYIDNSNNVVAEGNLISCTNNTSFYRLNTSTGNYDPATGIFFGMETYPNWGDQFNNVTVRNNLIAYCNSGIGFWSSEVATGGLKNVSIYNNTLWGSKSSAISINTSANHSNTIISNNIVQQDANKLAYVPSLTGLSFHHNYWVNALPTLNARGTGDLTGDVKLVTLPIYNNRDSFRISVNSPAIDTGATLPVTTDAFGGSRPYNTQLDIGAHEYRPVITPTPTSTVTATASTTPTLTPTPTPTPSVYPASLTQVYFTFAKLRYNKYASPSQLYSGDMIYFKNFDTSKLKLLQVFLYDYEKKGNQGYTQSKVTTQSMYVRTNYLLPTGKKYAYVAKFQDRATGIIATKYFVVYTTKIWLGQSVE